MWGKAARATAVRGMAGTTHTHTHTSPWDLIRKTDKNFHYQGVSGLLREQRARVGYGAVPHTCALHGLGTCDVWMGQLY